MPPVPFIVGDRRRHRELLDDGPIDTLGYLPMAPREAAPEVPRWPDFAIGVKCDDGDIRVSEAALGTLSRQEAEQWFLGRSRRNGKATMRAMYRHVPSIHTRRCERVQPPARVDFDAGQVTVAPPLAFRLAGRSAQAEHLVQRLLFEDEGKAILWKLAQSLRVAGLRALAE